MSHIILMDLDGVLADFVLAFTQTGKRMFGGPVYTTHEQKDWHKFEGYWKYQVAAIWDAVRVDRDFWETCPDIRDEAGIPETHKLWELADKAAAGECQLYFVTSRVGATAKHQTEQWLERRGIVRPTVVVTVNKALVAEAVRATHMVDDSADQLYEVGTQAPYCQRYLVGRPYNGGAALIGVPVLKNLDRFVREVLCG